MNYENKPLKQLNYLYVSEQEAHKYFLQVESDKHFAKLVAIDKARIAKNKQLMKSYCDNMMQRKTKKVK